MRLNRAAVGLLLLVTLQAAGQAANLGPTSLRLAVIDLLEVGAAAAAALACLHRAHLLARRFPADEPAAARHRATVLGWRFVAAGAASWSLGQFAWTWYEVVVGREVPFPSLADVGYLGFPVLVGVGAVLLARGLGRLDHGLRALLDGLIVGGALLVISWELVLADIVTGGSSGLALAVSLAYPLGDITILALVMLLVSRSPADVALKLMAVGLCLMAVADSAFVWLTASGQFVTGNALDVLWVAGFGLMSLVAFAPEHDEWLDADAGPSRLAVLLPNLPVAVSLGVVVLTLWQGRPVSRLATATVTVLVVALIARQSLSAVENVGLVHRLRAQEERLRELAYEDALTGAANRGRFTEELLARAVAVADDGRPITLAYVDLNGFKEINDRLGHAAGDHLLREFARRLTAVVDPGDLVARLGGDEFAVLLDVDDAPPVHAVRGRLERMLEQPFVLDGHVCRVTAAIGVVQEVVLGSPEEVADHVLRRADEAMYRDKAER